MTTPMTTIIVLFNLKPDADPAAYERWAAETDLPTVRNLATTDGFDVYRTTGVLGSDAPAPYQYVEMIRVSDMAGFASEVSTETMQKVASEFRGFADNPVFMLSEEVA
ncbi:REDY-like protein HapK [Lentisalinibacter salinarum]|uniref:REDY-like protein HapK n=1 Tax=Lentisalinibacter salinarum TaxID=2992239 RepID=UPI0038684060